jgi:hypothetical protein
MGETKKELKLTRNCSALICTQAIIFLLMISAVGQGFRIRVIVIGANEACFSRPLFGD